MNQKDYDEIAKILSEFKGAEIESGGLCYQFNYLVKKFANYFEKQKQKLNLKTKIRIFNYIGEELKPFDRKGFLRNCKKE